MKRCCIVGTAQSWKQTPWNDPGLYIVGINDAYTLGFPRVNEWWDLHPLDKFVFRKREQKVIYAHEVPPGHYVRPEGHVEWLKHQAATIPVWLQKEPPAGWPVNAQRFPIEQMEAKYGTYWASGPAYELMSLWDRGFREIHIYGIHLATEHEYREQRPNFEMLIGRLLGPEIRESVTGDVRVYEGKECRIILPVSAPILQHGWRYAYEPKPQGPPNPYAEEWAQVQQEKRELVKALIHWPKGKDKTAALARLQRLDVILLDIQQQLGKRQMGGTLAVSLVAA